MNDGRRLRVLLVAHDIHDRGGMERSFAELIRRTHHHHDFIVLSRYLAPELRPLVEWRRAWVPSRPGPLKQTAFYVVAGLLLRREAPDVIHTMGAVVLNRANLRSVHMCHVGFWKKTGSLAPSGAPRVRRMNRATSHIFAIWAERHCYQPRRTTLLAAVSHEVEAELHEHYPHVDVRMTPNGIEAERFRPRPAVRSEMRATHRVASGVTVVAFIGGEWDHKGLDLAIRGLAAARQRLSQTSSQLEMWVIGRGDAPRFSRLADDLGVLEGVRFLGFRPDVDRYLQAADLLLLPSLYETFSLVAHEAASCGLPVVATPVGGIKELVGKNEAGILITRDPGGIASALASLAQDTRLRRQLGAEARRRCSGLTWERSTDLVVELYQELAGTAGSVCASGRQPSRTNESMEPGHTDPAAM